MYDEYERALTGRKARRMSPLAWAGVTLFGLMVLGVAGAVAGLFFVRKQAQSIALRLSDNPALVVADMLARLDPELGLSAVAGPEGRASLRDLRSDEVATFDLQDLVRGSLHVSDGERQVDVDLQGDESGGSLVIAADGETVRIDLVRRDGGGSLVVSSSGGEGGELRFGTGAEAGEIPAWMPRDADMPDSPRHVFSARSTQGEAGAVTWETSREPAQVLEFYRARLEELGFDIGSQSFHQGSHQRQGSLWARDRDGGRVAFVVAAREDGRTSVVLGYGRGD